MVGHGDVSALRPRDTREGEVKGSANRAAESLREERMGKRGSVFPLQSGKGYLVKALEGLPRVVGSPWIVPITSSTSLCLSVPKCPYPSPRGTVRMTPRAQQKALLISGPQPLF